MKKDLTPWLLLPSIALALSTVTLLAPHQAALAAPPKPTQAAPQAGPADGDGDELLEHWGDPQFSREEQRQMAGMAAGFLLLGAAAGVRRARRKSRCETAVLPGESDFLKLAPQPKPDTRTDTRKAA